MHFFSQSAFFHVVRLAHTKFTNKINVCIVVQKQSEHLVYFRLKSRQNGALVRWDETASQQNRGIRENTGKLDTDNHQSKRSPMCTKHSFIGSHLLLFIFRNNNVYSKIFSLLLPDDSSLLCIQA